MANPTRAKRHKAARIDKALSRAHLAARGVSDELEPAIQENWSPKIEAIVRDKHLIVKVDLPGFAAEDVEVEIIDDILTIRGERKESHTERVSGYYSDETNHILFSRKIRLPNGTNAEEAIATFYEGALQITMCFSPSAAENGAQDDAHEGGAEIAEHGRSLFDEARRAFVGRIYRPLLLSVH